jgi:hypothetical protein
MVLRTSVFAAFLKMVDALANIALSCKWAKLVSTHLFLHGFLSATREPLDGLFESRIYPDQPPERNPRWHTVIISASSYAFVLLKGHL